MKTIFNRTNGLVAAWALAALAGTTVAHSWPEETVRLAPNGTMLEKKGHERGRLPSDVGADYIIPPAPLNKVAPEHKLVREGQGKLTDSSYTTEFPMLSAAPGDWVAIKYRENGHVSRADATDPMKAINRGTVYLYGTTENDLSSLGLMDVHLKWTANGGDGKGKLLATRNYDDGQCHEEIPGSGDVEGIVQFRMDAITNVPKLLCQVDVQLPEDVPVGKTYTVIWVWDWSTMTEQGVAVPPASYDDPKIQVAQFYTGVVDYKIVDPCDESLGSVKGPTCSEGGGGASNKVQFVADQPATARGIATQMAEPFLVKVPQAGGDVQAATADPKNIPFGVLVGKQQKEFPLPPDILSAQNLATGGGAGGGGGGGGAKTPAPTPKPSGGSGSGSGSDASGGDGGEVVVTMTTTVPEGVTTMTVTRGEAAQTPAPKLKARAIPVRRRAAHW